VLEIKTLLDVMVPESQFCGVNAVEIVFLYFCGERTNMSRQDANLLGCKHLNQKPNAWMQSRRGNQEFVVMQQQRG